MSTLADFNTLLSMGGGCVYLIVAAAALLRSDPQPGPRRWLALYAVAGFAYSLALYLWNQGWPLFLQAGFRARLPLYALLLLAALLFGLTRAFLRLKGGPVWALAAVAWLGGILAADSGISRAPRASVAGVRVGAAPPGLYLGRFVGWLGAVQRCGCAAHPEGLSSHRPAAGANRVKFWLPPLGLAVAGDALYLAGWWAPAIVLRLVSILAAAYACLAPRLPAMRRAVLGALSALLNAALAVALFAAFLVFARAAFLALDFGPAWLGAVLLALLLALLLNPALLAVQRRLRRWISGPPREPTAILRQYSQSISNILDLPLLEKAILDVLPDAMEGALGRAIPGGFRARGTRGRPISSEGCARGRAGRPIPGHAF